METPQTIKTALDMAALAGLIGQGRSDKWLIVRGHDPVLIATVRRRLGKPNKPDSTGIASRWTPSEDSILRKYLYAEGEAGVAVRLGRSGAGAIRQRRRKKGIPGVISSREMSAAQVKWALGHGGDRRVLWLIKTGILPSTKLPTEKVLYNIRRRVFLSWATNTDNWVFFDHDKVRDPDLLRLLPAARRRWGDRWLRTRDIAEMYNVPVGIITNQIRLGRLPARQPVGRQTEYYILRSDCNDLFIRQGPRLKYGDPWVNWDSDAFIVMAAAIGMPMAWVDMVSGMTRPAAHGRWTILRRRGYVHKIIKDYDLPIQIRPNGQTFADWRNNTKRFPGIAPAVTRLAMGQKLTYWDKYVLGGIMAHWLEALGPVDPTNSPDSYRRGLHRVRDETIRLKTFVLALAHDLTPFPISMWDPSLRERLEAAAIDKIENGR